jgi:hypothetical protein
MDKGEPFGFSRKSIQVNTPPIELNPEIIIPDINIPEIKIPEIRIPEIKVPDVTLPPVTVKVDAPIVKVEPLIRVEPPVVQVMMPESKGWKFSIHKRKDGDIEMTAKPL